ncbi:DUF222 domain-containing protein [Cellulomonas sp. NPDC089187]|uniref:HNH endonuclease signature motif containing protein n=1 Tax=Cellulomonas sp. NPDC089187 TaxID=3154970 RepID=UPI0034262857
MALDLREHHPRALPVRSVARVLTDEWGVGGELSRLDRESFPEVAAGGEARLYAAVESAVWGEASEDGLTEAVMWDEVPPRWVEEPALLERVVAEQTAADPTMDPVGQVADVLAAENGPALAALLGNLDLTLLDVTDLPAVAAAARRLQAWAHAVSTRVAAELAERPEMNPVWPEHIGPIARPNIAADELSLRLNIGRRSAQALVDEGLAHQRWLLGTGQALASGRIDVAKARVMFQRLSGVDALTVAEVEVAVLPGAADRTPAQLAADVDRALLRVDPDGGARRRERARQSRRVSRPKALADGLAGIWAVLPAERAAQLDRALDASARALLRGGDQRTHAQLRADALVDAVLVGPDWARLLPGHHGCDDVAVGGDQIGVRACTHGAAVDAEGRGHPEGAASGGLHPGPSQRAPRVEVRVTVPLSSLIGADDAPGRLDGHGPIDAATARALAAGGTWRRLVTDPLAGTVLDVGRRRYRPPPGIADHVIARDQTCARPGCTVPADACDLDHTVPFGVGGSTSVGNLAPLCRRDHLLRTHAGHRIEQASAGQMVWTSPTRQYVSVPGQDGAHRLVTEDDPIPF